MVKRFYFVLILGGLFMLSLNARFLPIANTEDILAVEANPAALGFGNALGLGFRGYFDADYNSLEEPYDLYFSGDNLAYRLHHGNTDEHRLAFGFKVLRNLYAGSAYDWTNSDFWQGYSTEALLYRPSDYLSLAATGYRTFSEDEAEYRLGAAVRPLAWSREQAYRLSFSIDLPYQQKEWRKPVLGVQLEPFDGILVGGSYDLEQECAAVNFGLRLGRLNLGSRADYDTDNNAQGGYYYLHLSAKNYRTIFSDRRSNKVYEFPLQGEIIDKKAGVKIGPFTVIGSKNKTMSELREELRLLGEDDRIAGIVIRNTSFSTSLANISELRDALLEFKAEGKKIVFYYEFISNSNYALAASVADAIYLHPGGMVDLHGLGIAMPYVKDLLDTLGIEVVNFRSHDYKTAGNMFTETEMTPAEREAYDLLLTGLYGDFSAYIAAGREDRLAAPVDQIINEGPYLMARNALEAGLVDELIYEDQLEEKLKSMVPQAKVIKKVDRDYVQYNWSEEATDRIALIYCIGTIHSGKGQSGKSIGSESTAKAIRKARKDKTIKGIILRIDSGGGSSLASEVISREIELCRQDKKPVVVSMGGTAASGGYHIAALADRIIAQPTTVTGSIGVIGMTLDLSRLYNKLHINWSHLRKGERADFASTSRPMTESEKQLFQQTISDSYEQFVEFVARARNMDKAAVHEVAQGRVWTGRQALERGLIDELGGMDRAVQSVQEIAGLENEPELLDYTEKSGFELLLGGEFGSLSSQILLPEDIERLEKNLQKFRLLEHEKILKVIPYDLEIK